MSNKRDRELARARYQRQQARRQQKASRNRTLKQVGSGLFVVVLLSAFAASRTPGKDAASSATPSPNASSTLNCSAPATVRADNLSWKTAPKDPKPATGIKLSTNCGDINITLDPKAPKTAGVMTYLAKQKYFDNTQCHRLTTSGIFVLQCGDPKGNGTGGPGFSFADENLPTGANGVYKAGTVAMANSGPNTNGSQFFLVYKDSPLPANYSVWGTVTGGMDILTGIADAGVANGTGDGAPAQKVVISKATTS